MRVTPVVILFFLTLPSCKVNYSFTGASISPEIKSFSINYFPKSVSLGPPTLSQTITEMLRQKFVSQTSLTSIERNGDIAFEGSITNYVISPLSIQPNELAAQNRLTITLQVKFVNRKDEKNNFDSSFSRYADYASSKNLAEVEEELINEISTQLVDDIFNKAVINW